MSVSTGRKAADAPEAMVVAGRTLPGHSGAQLFLEERMDARLEISDRGRTVSIARTRGAVMAEGEWSIHRSDPTPDEIVSMATRGRDLQPEPVRTERATPEMPSVDLERLEGGVHQLVAQESSGLGDLQWSASIVAFHQNIWVTAGEGKVLSDTRRGARVELRIAAHRYPNIVGVAERVIPEGQPAMPPGFFTSAWERLEERRRARPASRGSTIAVFENGVAGVLIHELVGHALEGDAAWTGSWIQGTLPKPPRCLTIVDEPPRGRGGWRRDDEGVPAGGTVLVDQGRVAGVLLDKAGAAARGVASNGHGRRATYLDPVRPRMGCTYIAQGQDDGAEIIRDTTLGIFIRRMTAGQTDPRAGRASFIVTDARAIAGGALDAPIEPFVMHVHGEDLWRTIDRIGSDLAFDTCIGSCIRDGQPLAVSVGAPTIRIGVITVDC